MRFRLASLAVLALAACEPKKLICTKDDGRWVIFSIGWRDCSYQEATASDNIVSGTAPKDTCTGLVAMYSARRGCVESRF